MKMDKTDFSSNKEDNEFYFDTCASNHFVNHVPEIFDSSKIGTVNGSTGHSTDIIGQGIFKVGKVNITASITPGLDANLVSGGRLIGSQKYAAVLKKGIKDDLRIYEDNSNLKLEVSEDLVAIGRLDQKICYA